MPHGVRSSASPSALPRRHALYSPTRSAAILIPAAIGSIAAPKLRPRHVLASLMLARVQELRRFAHGTHFPMPASVRRVHATTPPRLPLSQTSSVIHPSPWLRLFRFVQDPASARHFVALETAVIAAVTVPRLLASRMIDVFKPLCARRSAILDRRTRRMTATTVVWILSSTT